MKYHIDFDLEFRTHNYPGKLIVLEGNEGSGKTTQVERLTNILNQKGYKAITTKEPTHMPIGEFIRNKILNNEIKAPRIAVQYLYCADRAMHQEEFEKYLKEGYIVISDRYFWSSVAYGIADYNGDGDYYLLALSILSPYHRFIKPDLTFYLDVDLETAMNRIKDSHKHKEIYDNSTMFPKIKKGYDFLLSKFPEEFIKINARKSIKEVGEEIISNITSKIEKTT